MQCYCGEVQTGGSCWVHVRGCRKLHEPCEPRRPTVQATQRSHQKGQEAQLRAGPYGEVLRAAGAPVELIHEEVELITVWV